MEKKCYVIGVYPPPYGGATVKCELFCDTLEDTQISVEKIDAYEPKRHKNKIFKTLQKYISAFKSDDTIVYCLDSKRLKISIMLQSLFPKSYKKTTILAIGGVFHETIDESPFLKKHLKKADGIWVETEGMKLKLLERGFKNIKVFPNPKLEKGWCIPTTSNTNEPLRLLYFSQISEEKGVEDIIKLVELLDRDGNIPYQLDFYGHIVTDFEETFDEFIEKSKKVRYCGVFDSTKSNVYQKINEYDILLFPTHWNTEGVPGILVEAKMAGVAVIASDRSYNSELIQVDKNEGVVIHKPYFSEMYKYIKQMYFDREYLQKIKEGSSQSRKRYALEEYQDMIQKLVGGGHKYEIKYNNILSNRSPAFSM